MSSAADIMELAMVIVVVNAAAFVVGRKIWIAALASRSKTAGRPGCGGACQSCRVEMIAATTTIARLGRD